MNASLSIRLNRLLVEHTARYSHWQVRDVYKLIHQAAMGSGHAVRNITRARVWLEQELESLSPDDHQPLIEQISPEAKLEKKVVRVHLRPYLAATNDPEPLLEAFVRTANEFVASIQRLEQYAQWIFQSHPRADLYFSLTDLKNFMGEMCRRDFPPVHHSDDYVLNYQPAYRVVKASLIDLILRSFPSKKEF